MNKYDLLDNTRPARIAGLLGVLAVLLLVLAMGGVC